MTKRRIAKFMQLVFSGVGLSLTIYAMICALFDFPPTWLSFVIGFLSSFVMLWVDRIANHQEENHVVVADSREAVEDAMRNILDQDPMNFDTLTELTAYIAIHCYEQQEEESEQPKEANHED